MTESSRLVAGDAGSSSDDRLESWKEIAAYLRRGVTTVQRWENREELPVHRLPHGKQGSVYALKPELDAWWERRRQQLETQDTALVAEEEPRDAGVPEVNPGPSSERIPAHPTGRGRRWLLPSIGLAAAVGGLVWIASTALSSTPRPASAPVARFQLDPAEGTTFAGNTEHPQPVLSSDGHALVFRAASIETGRQTLFLRKLDSTVAQALAGTDNAILPFWSPDGRRIGFFADGFLRCITLATGRVDSLAPSPSAEGGAWRGDEIVFAPQNDSALYVIPITGGQPEPFTRLDAGAGERRHSLPAVLPDGTVLFHVDHRDAERQGVAASAGKGQPHRMVLAGPSMVTVAPPAHLLRFHQGTLKAYAFDARNLAVTGEAIELAERIEAGQGEGHAPHVSAAGSTLAYWDPKGGPVTRLTWFDRQGRETGTIGPPGHYPSLALSPDGTQVAVQRTFEVGGSPDLWLFGAADGKATRLTSSPVNDEDPVWRPDSTALVFAKHRRAGEPSDLHRLDLSRPLEDAPLWRGELSAHPTDWSRDGKSIVFQVLGRGTKSDVWIVDANGSNARPVSRSEFDEMHGRLSPDGRYLALSSDQSGRREVYVRELGPGGAVWQVSNAGGAHPRWRADGRELFYLSAGGHVVAVPLRIGPRLQPGTPVPLFHARPVLPLVFSDVVYDVAPDGSRFLVAAGPPSGARPITLVLNWQAQLPRQ